MHGYVCVPVWFVLMFINLKFWRKVNGSWNYLIKRKVKLAVSICPNRWGSFSQNSVSKKKTKTKNAHTRTHTPIHTHTHTAIHTHTHPHTHTHTHTHRHTHTHTHTHTQVHAQTYFLPHVLTHINIWVQIRHIRVFLLAQILSKYDDILRFKFSKSSKNAKWSGSLRSPCFY
jgi:hypothetical protein